VRALARLRYTVSLIAGASEWYEKVNCFEGFTKVLTINTKESKNIRLKRVLKKIFIRQVFNSSKNNTLIRVMKLKGRFTND
jgi:hypothetical protein